MPHAFCLHTRFDELKCLRPSASYPHSDLPSIMNVTHTTLPFDVRFLAVPEPEGTRPIRTNRLCPWRGQWQMGSSQSRSDYNTNLQLMGDPKAAELEPKVEVHSQRKIRRMLCTVEGSAAVTRNQPLTKSRKPAPALQICPQKQKEIQESPAITTAHFTTPHKGERQSDNRFSLRQISVDGPQSKSRFGP